MSDIEISMSNSALAHEFAKPWLALPTRIGLYALAACVGGVIFVGVHVYQYATYKGALASPESSRSAPDPMPLMLPEQKIGVPVGLPFLDPAPAMMSELFRPVGSSATMATIDTDPKYSQGSFFNFNSKLPDSDSQPFLMSTYDVKQKCIVSANGQCVNISLSQNNKQEQYAFFSVSISKFSEILDYTKNLPDSKKSGSVMIYSNNQDIQEFIKKLAP